MEETGTTTIEKGERGVSSTAWAITVLGIVMCGAIGFVYIAHSDRLNGLDAYRVKEYRDRGTLYKQKCEFNHGKLQEVHEYLRQNANLKPPPSLLVIQPCIADSDIDNKEHK